MALERVCRVERKDFMRPYIDHIERYANVEANMGQTVFNARSVIAPPLTDSKTKETDMKLGVRHGTTTLGFKYKGGILLCADSRGTCGDLIASQDMEKIIAINKDILGTISGGAADCMYWNRVLIMECRLYELTYGHRMPVRSVARIMSNILSKFRGMDLNMGMLMAGYDFDGPKLFYVDSTGGHAEGELFATGSGTLSALGILDTFYSYNMSDAEAYNLALLGIYHATYLDCFTGGLVRLYHMREKKWGIVAVKDCRELAEIFGKAYPDNNFKRILTCGFQPSPMPNEDELEQKKAKKS